MEEIIFFFFKKKETQRNQSSFFMDFNVEREEVQKREREREGT